ncbi:MAG: MFS transporter [Candidatus Tectomicrobia bacterium]|uniref:MFS transporter n=1 Tax=Tectimicrobiota bacterium TaxID=2528274 RepID=A0A937VYI0_UNCTE|nr:MFS transporter [Candidatus Tectomicrobia bacterium]
MVSVTPRRRLKNFLLSSPMILVMGLTLLLLVYVGFGEAKRKYLPFQLGKLATQGEIIQNAFDAYLQAGLPLKQFSGFTGASEALLFSDPSIENIRVTDTHFNPVFVNKQASMSPETLEALRAGRVYHPSKIRLDRPVHAVTESQDSMQIAQALKNKFGVVGYVFIEASRDSLMHYLDQRFRLAFYACAGLFALFSALVAGHAFVLGTSRSQQRLLKAGFTVTFLAMSVVIGVVVLQVYQFGAQASTKALADSMAKRLSSLLELGLDIRDVSGIDQALQDYKDRNPDISAIALTENGVALSHTNRVMVGAPYSTPKNSLEHVNELPPTHVERLLKVAVTIPSDIILKTIQGSAKAFIVLFIACGLIALIFLNAGTAYLQVLAEDQAPSSPAPLQDHGGVAVAVEKTVDARFEIGLHLIKPAYFLIVFVSALSLSFLPQWISEFAKHTGSSLATASLPFTLYYLFFALSLIPSGQYAEHGDVKKLMGLGFVAELAGLAILAVSYDYWLVTLGRVSSGIGQGVFLIGLQGYVTAITPKDKRSLGHAVKVTGRNAALIAGSAIGALLAAYMDYRTLFVVSSVITAIAMLYLTKLVPGVDAITRKRTATQQTVQTAEASQRANAFLTLLHDMKAVSKDGEFLRTLILIGVIGKISIAGVVMFGVPLMLSAKGFATEDIGLALMLYYISGLITTDLAARVVDGEGVTRQVLTLSAVLGGAASLFLGCVGVTKVTQAVDLPGFALMEQFAVDFNAMLASLGLPDIQMYAMLCFIVLIGISNGLLAAPVMTHINNANISKKRGMNSVAATYTFMERFGHVLGPAVMTKLLWFTNQSTLAVSLFGALTILLGIWFCWTSNLKPTASEASQ